MGTRQLSVFPRSLPTLTWWRAEEVSLQSRPSPYTLQCTTDPSNVEQCHYICGLSTATIEYSPMCACVCVCVCLHDNS